MRFARLSTISRAQSVICHLSCASLDYSRVAVFCWTACTIPDIPAVSKLNTHRCRPPHRPRDLTFYYESLPEDPQDVRCFLPLIVSLLHHMRRKYSSPLCLLSTLMSATGFSLGCLVVAVLWLVGPPSAVAADLSVPANVDSHLQRLLERWQSTATSKYERRSANGGDTSFFPDTWDIPSRFDANGRVLVHIHLDGTQSMEAVEHALNSQQIKIQAKNATYRHGIMAQHRTRAAGRSRCTLGRRSCGCFGRKTACQRGRSDFRKGGRVKDRQSK